MADGRHIIKIERRRSNVHGLPLSNMAMLVQHPQIMPRETKLGEPSVVEIRFSWSRK